MKQTSFTCIRCPIGCPLEVTLEKGQMVTVTGNECRLGLEYAKKESTHPTRMVTTTIPLAGGTVPVLPVKASQDIPKESIFSFLQATEGIRATAPVTMGQVIATNVAGTGADLIATRTLAKKDT